MQMTLLDEQRDAGPVDHPEQRLCHDHRRGRYGQKPHHDCEPPGPRSPGFKARGYAFTNRMVKNMTDDGFQSDTIAKGLIDARRGRVDWDDKTVIYIDEAAQLKTEDLHDILWMAKQYGSKVVAVGDRRQLGAIERGGLWHSMEREHGSAKLEQIMRVQEAEQKSAFNKMHKRGLQGALKQFQDHTGAIRWSATKAESIQDLAENLHARHPAVPRNQADRSVHQ